MNTPTTTGHTANTTSERSQDTDLDRVTQYLAQWTPIRSTLLRDGMYGPKGAVTNIRRAWVDGVEYVVWTNGDGASQYSAVEDGWVDVHRNCVTHRVTVSQRPEYTMGCYTGNYYCTATCHGCGEESGETMSGFMANRWAIEHEQGQLAVSR